MYYIFIGVYAGSHMCTCNCACTLMDVLSHRLLKLRGQLARVSSFLQYIGPMVRNQVARFGFRYSSPSFTMEYQF